MIRSLLKTLAFIAIIFVFSIWWKAKEPVIEPQEEPITDTTPLSIKEKLRLHKSSFEDLKNWQNDNMDEMVLAFKASCDKAKNSKSEFLSEAEIKIPRKLFLDTCDYFNQEKAYSSQSFRSFVEDNFTPYLVTYENEKEGKFTSYYEAAIFVSRNKNSKYKHPIYARPKDLIEFNPRDFDETAENKRYVGRVKGTKLVPYYTRAEIDKGLVDAPILLWSNSLVDIHVMQIQGSAVGYFEDGSSTRIGYADNNGHKFKGIGSILLEKKLIQPGQSSMGKIKKWLNEKGEQAVDLLNENNRYIFFREIKENHIINGPIGAQGIPLTSGRSIAVDNKFIPLGTLLWLETIGPNNEPIEKLVIAQDVGSAIKGAVRGDYFWGSGHDDVLELAGKMNSKGHYYIMLPNTMEIQ